MIISTVHCDLCKTTDDVEPMRIGAREGHLCGCCKRALYAVIDGDADPALPTADAKGLAANVRGAWMQAVRPVQDMLDREVQRHRDEEETERQAAATTAREAREAEEKANAEAAVAAARAEAEAAQATADREAARVAAEAARDQAIVDLTAELVAVKELLAKQ